jgi:hypothetical protein
MVQPGQWNWQSQADHLRSKFESTAILCEMSQWMLFLYEDWEFLTFTNVSLWASFGDIVVIDKIRSQPFCESTVFHKPLFVELRRWHLLDEVWRSEDEQWSILCGNSLINRLNSLRKINLPQVRPFNSRAAVLRIFERHECYSENLDSKQDISNENSTPASISRDLHPHTKIRSFYVDVKHDSLSLHVICQNTSFRLHTDCFPTAMRLPIFPSGCTLSLHSLRTLYDCLVCWIRAAHIGVGLHTLSHFAH